MVESNSTIWEENLMMITKLSKPIRSVNIRNLITKCMIIEKTVEV